MKLLTLGIATSTLPLLISSFLCAETSKASDPLEQCGRSDRPYRITARHIEPQGIGYNQGYTTLEGFFPLYSGWDAWVPFLDLRGHVFNNGKPALNTGLGIRYLTNNRVWGINSYYDYRNTNHQHYNQVALGLESLGKRWDFRLNGYLPVGKKQSLPYGLQFVGFEEHTALLREKYEYALPGLNAEGGAHVECWKNFPLYFAAGPYYLTGKGSSTWGGKVRASVRIFDYLKIDGNVSYDHLFKWIGQGQVGLSFSFGGKKKVLKEQKKSCSTSLMLAERSHQPVDRFEIIPVDKKYIESAAIDPRTGLPYQFIFVKNTSASLGTYKSPYHSLAQAETNSHPYDILYIFPGDGTTTGLDQGITLQDYQKLWGSGIDQKLTTALGSVTIPAQSNGTYQDVVITPLLTNSSGSVVSVGSGNEISGLFLANQSIYDCITSTDGNSLTLLNSTLAEQNAAGAKGINANGLSGVLRVSGCTINQGINGIFLENSSGSLTTHLSNTAFSSAGGDNAVIQWVLTNTAEGHLNVSNCTATTRNSAIQVDLSDTSSITTLLNDNTFCTGFYGVYINSASGETSIEANIKNNTMTTYYQSIRVIQTGSADLNLNKNTLFATSEPTFQIDTNTGSTSATLTIAHNSFITDASDNIFLNHSDGNLTAFITENNFKGTDYNTPIHSSISSTADNHTLTINNNTLFAGDNGIYINQQTGSVNVSLQDNLISSLYSSYGVSWHMENTPTSSSLTMYGNVITGYQGLYIDQSSSSPLDVLFNDNKVDATDAGVNFRVNGESSNTLSMSGNTISGFAPITLTQYVGSINATLKGNLLTSAGNQALYYNVISSGSIPESTLTAIENTITTAGFGGPSGSAVYLSLHATGPITTNFTHNTLNGDTYAMKVELDGITHTMDLSNNTIPLGGGYSLTANSGSGYWTINNNTFTALSSSPVAVNTTGGDICMQLNHNTAYPVLNAYHLTATSGTLTVNTPEGNIGEITESGTTHGSCP